MLSLVAGTPLLLAFFCFFSVAGIKKILPVAALPALFASFIVPQNIVVEVPWFFMGGLMGLDQTGSIFLCLSGFIWLLAGLAASNNQFSVSHNKRFHGFFLIAMSGNFGLILAQGMLGYYLFFAIMSFAVYGLVIADNTRQALKAGGIYLIMVMISEITMFIALILLTRDTASLIIRDIGANVLQPLVFLFLYIAFGVKIGALPVHGWMVSSYQNTPTPATAALAGSMVNAGILGWLRFLPLGKTESPDWAIFFILAGVLATFYGVISGFFKQQIKPILACSSISQMGIMTVIFGLGLLSSATGKQAEILLILFAVHHALAKSCLFLGYNVTQKSRRPLAPWQVICLIIPALTLTGLPLTSGAIVKTGLKELTLAIGAPWNTFSLWFLPMSSLGTTLLILHFVKTLLQEDRFRPNLSVIKNYPGIIPWFASLASVCLTFWIWPAASQYIDHALKISKLWQSLWPVLAGALLSAIFLQSSLSARITFSHFFSRTTSLYFPVIKSFLAKYRGSIGKKNVGQQLFNTIMLSLSSSRTLIRFLRNSEKIIGRWTVTGIFYLLLVLLLIFLTHAE